MVELFEHVFMLIFVPAAGIAINLTLLPNRIVNLNIIEISRYNSILKYLRGQFRS